MKWLFSYLRGFVSLFKQGIGAVTKGGTPISTFDEWVWPMAMMKGRFPKVSDPFYTRSEGKKLGKRLNKDGSSRGHYGIDVLYPRKAGDNPKDFLTVTKRFVMPRDAPSLAAGPGKVYSAKMTSHGGEVKINHRVDGRPVLTVHRHLDPIAEGIKKGKIVSAGKLVGFIASDPDDEEKIAHTHWELWFTDRPGRGREKLSVDPEPFLANFPVMTPLGLRKLAFPKENLSSLYRKRKHIKQVEGSGTEAKLIGLAFLAWAGFQWFMMVRK